MATGDILSICNRSLLSIGSQSQIGNINEGSTQANACAVLFTPCFEALARSAYWNCFRQQAVLSLLAAAPGTQENITGTPPFPPTPWLYMYQLPSDSLQARFIIPSIPAPGGNNISPAYVSTSTVLPQGQIPFRVAYSTDMNNNPIQVILTNEPQAQLVYTVNQPNPQIWDSQFQAAMVATLAAYLVPALSLNLELAKLQAAIAQKMIDNARVRDGDEGSTSQDHIPDWIVARSAGSTIWNNSGYGYNYVDMCWGF